MTAEKGFDLETNYLVLADGPERKRIEVGPDFWQTIDQRDDLAGRLVGVFRYDADWNSWEMHPDGDEIVVLLSGAVDLVLDEAGGERTVELRDRAAASCRAASGTRRTCSRRARRSTSRAAPAPSTARASEREPIEQKKAVPGGHGHGLQIRSAQKPSRKPSPQELRAARFSLSAGAAPRSVLGDEATKHAACQCE